MSYSKVVAQLVNLSVNKEIEINDNVKFCINVMDEDSDVKICSVEKIKGDFDIVKIFSTGIGEYLQYDEDLKRFTLSKDSYSDLWLYIAMKNLKKEVLSYELNITKNLYVGNGYEDTLTLHGHDDLVFEYSVNEIGNNLAELKINNCPDVEIQGKKDDFVLIVPYGDINMTLFFTLDQKICDEETWGIINCEEKNSIISDNTIIYKSDPVSSDDIKYKEKVNIKREKLDIDEKLVPMLPTLFGIDSLYDIIANTKLGDAVLIPSDQNEIYSLRCVLETYSTIFKEIFGKTTVLPVTIHVNNFDADTVKAVLGFLYGKPDLIVGKEDQVLQFANEYNIGVLKDAVCSFFVKQFSEGNICQVIEFAYSHDFPELKEKCKQIMIDRNSKPDCAKLTDLSRDVLDYFWH